MESRFKNEIGTKKSAGDSQKVNTFLNGGLFLSNRFLARQETNDKKGATNINVEYYSRIKKTLITFVKCVQFSKNNQTNSFNNFHNSNANFFT